MIYLVALLKEHDKQARGDGGEHELNLKGISDTAHVAVINPSQTSAEK